jgi:ATP-dependent RNA helicase DDX41
MGKYLHSRGFPKINVMLCIGGIDLSEQIHKIKYGVHIIVATPGRLSDLVNQKKINLD